MLQELRKKSKRKAIITFAVCMLFAAGILLLTWNELFQYLEGGIHDLNALQDKEIGKMVVEGDVYFLVDYYSYVEEGGEITEKDYLLPVGEQSFIGLVAETGDLTELDDIMQQSQEYMMEERDVIEKSVHVRGTIVEMPEEQLQYYKEYYGELDWGGEEIFLPYCIQLNTIGRQEMWFYVVLCVIFLILVIAAVRTLVKSIKGDYEKMITDYCTQSGSYEHTLSKIESFYQMTRAVGGIRISADYCMFPDGKKTVFMESNNLLWAYQSTTEHRTYGIKTGETYMLVLCTRGGDSYSLSVNSLEMVQELLKRIQDILPFVILGYSKELEQIFYGNRQEMIQESDRRRKELRLDPAAGIEENT